MKIGITGTTGLIGHAVADRLDADHEIVSIGRRPTAALKADLSRPDEIRQLDFSGMDAVVHCAGVTDEDFASDPSRAFFQSTLGMNALVDRAVACEVRRFVYISSAHVYGRLEGRISEASRPNPLSDYAIAHFASEQILRRRTNNDFRGVTFRPCAVFGIPPNLAQFRRWNLIPFSFPQDAIRLGHIRLRSDGLAHRNFVGADDVAFRIALWLEERNAAPIFRVINPIGRTSMTVLDFAQLCADICRRVLHRSCEVSTSPSAADTGEMFEYESLDRAKVGTCRLDTTVEQLMKLLVAEESRPRGAKQHDSPGGQMPADNKKNGT